MCLAGGALVQVFLSGPPQPPPAGHSAIFWYLLKAYDPAANLLLLLIAVVAFMLRRRPLPAGLFQYAGSHPAAVAAVLFVFLCLGSFWVYKTHPLSMDEYSALFQAGVFASGKLSGSFPPELLDDLIPPGFQNMFLSVSRSTGEVSSSYWPGFSLLLAPFAWLGVPWAANPAIGAISLLVICRLARRITGSQEAGGWAVLLAIASPVFIVSSLSYYSMPAHLMLNAAYALLLLRPTLWRTVAAGLIGSLALTLHNPLPHALFAIPFIVWLILRGGSLRLLACLALAYALPWIVLGLGWKLYLGTLASQAPSSGAAAPLPGVVVMVLGYLEVFTLPSLTRIQYRVAGLTKLWTWGALGIIVLAAWGYWLRRADTPVRLLAATLAATVLGFFLVPFDQGHGWGYRYAYPAWFVLPVLGAVALASLASGNSARESSAAELRSMAGWGIALSLVLCNALRLIQVESFMDRHLGQVPPLAQAALAGSREVIFVNARNGFYSIDLVQNDPFLRGDRIVMLRRSPERVGEVMARHFPGYARVGSGPWGEHWQAAK